MSRLPFVCLAAVMLVGAPVWSQQNAPGQVEQALKTLASGDIDGGIAALERIIAASPASFEARLGLGRALDLQGRHAAARIHLEEALKIAPADERNTALTALGISYAFEA